MKALFKVVALCVLLGGILPAKAYCYLDPGTGSFAFQIIMGILLSAVFAVKSFWREIMRFFSRLFSKDEGKLHE
jgi:hypothetical protein